MPAVDTRWMSTYDGGRLNLRVMLLVLTSVTRAASPRSHSRLNLNESTLDGSAIGARNARSASRSTSIPGRRNP